jgi:MoxR-like ATPase
MGVDPPRAVEVLDTATLVRLQRDADRVFVHNAVMDYAVRIVLTTREPTERGLPEIAPHLSFGASPRASLGLIAAGRALALIRNRNYVLPQDVFDVASEVLRHRLVLSYEALADGVTPDDIVARVIATVVAPRVAPSQDRTAVTA